MAASAAATRFVRFFPRRVRVAMISLLLGALGLGAIAVQTVPEFILFRERLLLSILDIEARIPLKPFDMATHDGLTLRSWYHAPDAGKPLIVYFAGRDGDLVRKPGHLFDLTKEGYGVLLAGYRGFGGNPGYPSEPLLYRDAATLLDTVDDARMAPDGVVLYGYSMGTGVASYAASLERPLGLILEAPFTSFGDAVRQQASRVPVWLVRTKFDNRARIGALDVPILLLAGGKDWVTPPSFAKALAAMNMKFASLYVFDEANHLNIIRHGASEKVAGFVSQFAQPRMAPEQIAESGPVPASLAGFH